MNEDPEIYKRAKELSTFFEQRVKDIENVSMKEILNKDPHDPNSAINELKNVTSKYKNELAQKVSKDHSEKSNP